jgi:enoyl-CoA hydratase/carnithine racemase
VEFREILYERDGAIRIIKINRPEVRNCIGPRTHQELLAAWDMFREDDEAYVAVITGVGDKAFCSGADLRHVDELVPTTAAEIAANNRGERPGYLGPSRWTDIYKPVIAAVNGVAYAGGIEWACWADLRIAEEHASFGVTCRRWNIGLADGGTVRLPRIVGMGRALDLIITGRVIGAAEAERIGLVNEIVPRGRSLARALELASYICALPQEAIRTDKESVMRGYNAPLPEAMRIEAECFNRLLGSPAMIEGLRRFRDRDHPDRTRDGAPVTPGLVRG